MFFKRFFLLGLILIMFNSVYSFNGLDADVLAVYTLDNTLADATGNQVNATNNGATSTSSNCPNGYSNCYDFDGTNDYITATSFTTDGTDFTWGGWFKFGTSTASNSDLISKYAGAGGKASIHLSAEALKEIRVYCGLNNNVDSTSTYAMGSELHYVAKVTSSDRLELYINGSLEFNSSCTGATNSNVWTIGQTTAGGNNYDGTANEVFFISRALTSSEISDIYNNGFTFASTPTISTNLSGTYNTNNLTGSATTSSLVNMSFYQNGVLLKQENNTNSTTYSLTSLSLGDNNISLKSVNADGTDYNNFTITYQPYMYLYFFDNVRSITVKNVSLYMGDLVYGNNTYEFTNEGYVSQNVTFEINNISSQVNETFNVTPTTIIIKAFDLNSLNQLTFNLTLSNSTTNQTYTNQGNFSKYYNETVTGNVTALISSFGYDDATYFLTINPFTSATLNAYLLSSNSSSVHQFTVQETDSGLALADVTIEVQQLINSSYTTISSKLTGSNGKTYFYLNPSEEYKVIFSKSGYVTATATTIPTVTEYVVKLSSTTDAFSYVEDISYYFKPLSDILQSNDTYSLQAFISGSSFTQTRFIITDSDGNTLYDSTSVNPSGTTFSYDYFINYTTNITSLEFNLSYILDGETFNIYKDYTIVSFSNESFFNNMVAFGNDTGEDSVLIKWFIIMLATVGIVIFGTTIGNSGVSLLLIPLFAGLSFISWLDWTTAALMIFISLVFFIGGRK